MKGRERKGQGRVRARGVGGRYSCRYRLDMITLELSNIHTTFHKRSLCVFFQFSCAVVQAAGSGWGEAVSGAPAPGLGLPLPWPRGCHPWRDIPGWGGCTELAAGPAGPSQSP